MSPFAPMPLIDDILLQYNVGQVVLLLFILSLPVGIVRSSRKIASVNFILFGLLFAIIPSIGGGPVYFALLGLLLLVIGPVFYTTASR